VGPLQYLRQCLLLALLVALAVAPAALLFLVASRWKEGRIGIRLQARWKPNRTDRALAWGTALTGFLLPIGTAAGVKLYLQAHYAPTLPWSAFVPYLLWALPLSWVYASPFYALAIAPWALRTTAFENASPLQRHLVILFAVAGGALGMVQAFIPFFQHFSRWELIILPYLVAEYLLWMLGGLTLGVVAALLASRLQPGPRSDDRGQDRSP
jgi:hypothetical protein